MSTSRRSATSASRCSATTSRRADRWWWQAGRMRWATASSSRNRRCSGIRQQYWWWDIVLRLTLRPKVESLFDEQLAELVYEALLAGASDNQKKSLVQGCRERMPYVFVRRKASVHRGQA